MHSLDPIQTAAILLATNPDSVRTLHESGLDSQTDRYLPVKAVSNTSHAEQEARGGGVVFDLLAQGDNMVVDYAIRNGNLGAPDFVEQPVSCEYPAAIADEGGQQLNLGSGRLQTLALAAEFETRQIQFASAKTVYLLAWLSR